MKSKMRRYSKKLAVLLLGALALSCVLTGAVFAATVDEMAATMLAAEREGAVTPTLSKLYGPEDVEVGYKVQNAVVDVLLGSDKIAGYKGALTAAPLMAKFKASEPATAVLFESGCFPEGAVIVLSRKGIMLEEEIGYRFCKRVDAPLKDVEELKSCISAVFPAIEVPLVAFETLDGVGAFDMVAANVGSWGCILGKEMPLAGLDLNTLEMKTTCNGEVFNTGKGSDAMGDQWSAMLWLVNNIVKHGRVIEEGHFVISGAMGAMKPAKPGAYVADFGPLGSISFGIEAQ